MYYKIKSYLCARLKVFYVALWNEYISMAFSNQIRLCKDLNSERGSTRNIVQRGASWNSYGKENAIVYTVPCHSKDFAENILLTKHTFKSSFGCNVGIWYCTKSLESGVSPENQAPFTNCQGKVEYTSTFGSYHPYIHIALFSHFRFQW